MAMDAGGGNPQIIGPGRVIDFMFLDKFLERHGILISIVESTLQDIFSTKRIIFMIGEGMTPKKEIEKSAEDFYDAVIRGMISRPTRFSSDKEMAKAASVPVGTFNEYKNQSKGTTRPNFFTIYKIAYVLCNGPPCNLTRDNFLFNRFQEASRKDFHNILQKIISLILADADLAAIIAVTEISHQRLSSPKKTNENS